MQETADLRKHLARCTGLVAGLQRLTLLAERLDIELVQEQLLSLLIDGRGYERAMIGRVDVQTAELTGWTVRTRLPHTQSCVSPDVRFSLQPASSILAQLLHDKRPRLFDRPRGDQTDPLFSTCPDLEHGALLPLVTRQRLLGVLLVDNPSSRSRLTPGDLRELVVVGSHAALVLGSMQDDIDRAYRTAAEHTRALAVLNLQEHHLQQLYGLSYLLDASLRIVPGAAENVRAELHALQMQAQQATEALRASCLALWPHEFDATRLANELADTAAAYGVSMALALTIDPHYNGLPLDVRQQIALLAFELLAYVHRRSATAVALTLTWSPVKLQLSVSYGRTDHDTGGPAADASDHDVQQLRLVVEPLGGRVEAQQQATRHTEVVVTLPVGW